MTARLGRKLAAGLAALVLIGTVASSALGAGSRRSMNIYAVATHAQYVDHSDDRQRGNITNPFAVETPAVGQKEKGKGPFAGDNALFAFNLYSDPGLKHKVGTAVYSCTFNFGHQAFCSANFQLTDGTMSASGAADFDTTTFTLAVSGGNGAYLGLRGQVSSSPAGKDAHQLAFLLR